MTYTDDMRKAFHSITPPKGFGVDIIDNEFFITIRLDEKNFARMSHDDRIEALQYVVKVKSALEQNGAIVLVVRKALDK